MTIGEFFVWLFGLAGNLAFDTWHWVVSRPLGWLGIPLLCYGFYHFGKWSILFLRQTLEHEINPNARYFVLACAAIAAVGLSWAFLKFVVHFSRVVT